MSFQRLFVVSMKADNMLNWWYLVSDVSDAVMVFFVFLFLSAPAPQEEST